MAEHAIAAFSSGDAAIDAFLHDHAIPEQAMGLSQIYIAEERSRPRSVVSFFTLSPHSINLDSRLLVALGVHNDEVPYPKVGGYLLGRLGVDIKFQHQGIGASLVAIAASYARKYKEESGGVFIAVDAKTEKLADWYVEMGFGRLGESKRVVQRL